MRKKTVVSWYFNETTLVIPTRMAKIQKDSNKCQLVMIRVAQRELIGLSPYMALHT